MALPQPPNVIRPSGAEGQDNLLTWKDKAGTQHILNADLVLNAKDSRGAKKTQHPVESGSDVSDHIVFEPGKFRLEVAQTQTPITEEVGFSQQTLTLTYAKSPVRGLVALAVEAVSNLISGNEVFGGGPDTAQIDIVTLQTNTPVDRVADIHDQFIEVFQNAYPVTITFKGRTYPEFLILSVELSHNKGEVGLGRFVLECEEFVTVSTDTATLPDPKDLRAKESKSKGKKGEHHGEPDTKRLRSFLKNALDASGFTANG